MAMSIDDVVAAINTLTAIFRNTPKIQIFNVAVQTAGQPISLPEIVVPDGLTLILESMGAPPHINTGILIVSGKGNQSQVKPLRPGQNVGFNTTNTDDIIVTGTVVGDILILYCERR